METHIYDEKNGLSYTLHGDYYLPDLVLNEEKPIYGKYGMLRKQFLKEHRLAKYQYLLLTRKLTEHLNHSINIGLGKLIHELRTETEFTPASSNTIIGYVADIPTV